MKVNGKTINYSECPRQMDMRQEAQFMRWHADLGNGFSPWGALHDAPIWCMQGVSCVTAAKERTDAR